MVEFYSCGDAFIKCSSYNKNTKGFRSEFNILNSLSDISFVPKPIAFDEVEGIEILIINNIEGEVLGRDNFNDEIAIKIYKALQHLYKRGVVHGDIKRDNILVNSGEPYIIDFDQAYTVACNENFERSPDIVGNNGLNYINLIKGLNL